MRGRGEHVEKPKSYDQRGARSDTGRVGGDTRSPAANRARRPRHLALRLHALLHVRGAPRPDELLRLTANVVWTTWIRKRGARIYVCDSGLSHRLRSWLCISRAFWPPS